MRCMVPLSLSLVGVDYHESWLTKSPFLYIQHIDNHSTSITTNVWLFAIDHYCVKHIYLVIRSKIRKGVRYNQITFLCVYRKEVFITPRSMLVLSIYSEDTPLSPSSFPTCLGFCDARGQLLMSCLKLKNTLYASSERRLWLPTYSEFSLFFLCDARWAIGVFSKGTLESHVCESGTFLSFMCMHWWLVAMITVIKCFS